MENQEIQKKLDLKSTAILITDPQNDFLSEGGAVWDLVGSEVKKYNVVEKLNLLRQTAKKVGIPVFYSPHYYTENEYKTWQHLNFVDKVMFERKMFTKGTWGADFLPELKPDENTIVLSPHKGLSNFSYWRHQHTAKTTGYQNSYRRWNVSKFVSGITCKRCSRTCI